MPGGQGNSGYCRRCGRSATKWFVKNSPALGIPCSGEGGDLGATSVFPAVIIMPNYEVTLEVDPDRVGEMEGYMRTEHIPEILRTGCFSRITFERSDSGRFRTRYEAASQEALDAYFRDHAERLRQDFRGRFPQGVVPSREVWTEVERWSGDPENVR
jgi:Domain of unknown function (DUF4286)